MSKRSASWLLIVLLVVALLPMPSARAQETARPSVGGLQLERTTAGPATLFYDADVDAEVIATAQAAILTSLTDVPELTGLPAFTTPIHVFILTDDERFRLALSEIAGVRVELVAEEIGGYAIERDGTMLVFFAAINVTDPSSAVLGFAHEFAHLAVREATQRRAVPQWFNEGYATWIANLALARHAPAEAALQNKIDRMTVASALHTRGLIPWADLVTRVRFSRAGVDGLVNLAYGQSTLFIDFLAKRHGTPALARFLTEIGGGLGATQAFSVSMTPFSPEAAAFDASLAALKAETPAGLHVLQRASDQQQAVVAMIGGATLEPAIIEVLADGEIQRRREIDLDGAGFLVIWLPQSLLNGPSAVRLRMTAPLLGTLEMDPNRDDRALPAVTPAPVVIPAPAPQPAPVQVPARVSLLPENWRLAA